MDSIQPNTIMVESASLSGGLGMYWTSEHSK
jgi:hypothetical protein